MIAGNATSPTPNLSLNADVSLRPCPYCGNEKPTLVAMGGDKVQRVSVVCTECGAVGLTAAADDLPGHAEYLWNLRYGAN